MAYSAAALPAEANAAPVIEEMRKIMADYAANGVPADLVEAAKRREIAGAEFRQNSISGLAEAWSDALAAEGRNSPDDDVEAMKRVTLADVNRVAKQYLVDQDSITAQLKPAAHRRGRGLQRIWRRRAGYRGAHQAGGIAFLGQVPAAGAEIAARAARADGRDFAQRSAPDREHGQSHSDHHRDR